MSARLSGLRSNRRLYDVLAYYDEKDLAGQPAWKERLAQLISVERHELTSIHGLLLAYGWIVSGFLADNEGPSACYAITPAGRRALRHLASSTGQPRRRPGAA
jgi:hypothetical protein